LLREAGLATCPLLTVARIRSLSGAVDMLFAGAMNVFVPPVLVDDEALAAVLSDGARLGEAAERYASAHPQPDWLFEVSDDDTFLDRLGVEVAAFSRSGQAADTARGPRFQSLAVRDDLKAWLGHAASAVRNAVGAVVGSVSAGVKGAGVQGARDAFLAISGFIRPAASAFIGRFCGDVFTYMENRQPILDRVLADVDHAIAARREGDSEIYLVGHSFGGIILYDILTRFRPDLECDLYVTVGSQVGLFAEMGRLADRATIEQIFAAGPTAVVPRPRAARRWLNVFDSTDLVGFGTRGVFSGARDLRFETDALPLVSHAAYLDTPRFFGRLRERVREAFEEGTDTP
jgi:hypothetical protein